jgi:hypothetical protein
MIASTVVGHFNFQQSQAQKSHQSFSTPTDFLLARKSKCESLKLNSFPFLALLPISVFIARAFIGFSLVSLCPTSRKRDYKCRKESLLVHMAVAQRASQLSIHAFDELRGRKQKVLSLNCATNSL